MAILHFPLLFEQIKSIQYNYTQKYMCVKRNYNNISTNVI